MIIKNQNHRGKRSILKCLNCGDEFSELDIKIRSGYGKFCSNKCYQEWRKKNSFNPKERNKLYQKKCKYNLTEDEYKNLFRNQDNKCAICGCKQEHNGKPLVFILDHIDGDASNNKRDNLRCICPNCDSQLDTYKARNKGKSTRIYMPFQLSIRNNIEGRLATNEPNNS